MYRNLFLFTFLLGACVFSYSQAVNLEWASKVGGKRGESIVCDASGNMISTGYFGLSADFDPGAGTHFLTTNGFWDIFIQKLDSSGNLLWAKQMGGIAEDVGASIAVDDIGNIITTGRFQDTVDFDPGPGVFNLSSNGDRDIFIQKLDSNGNFVWAKRIGGTDSDQGVSTAVDANGNICVTGQFGSTVDFDPGPGTHFLTVPGNAFSFFLKLDPNGNFLWVKHIHGAVFSNSLAVDIHDNFITTGSFITTVGPIDFDPGPGSWLMASNLFSHDIYILKLDANGNFVWARKMGTDGNDTGRSITTDNWGNIYSTGSFSDTVDFDPGPGIANSESNGLLDIYIQKLDSSGNFRWANHFGGPGDDIGYSIISDDSGDVYTTGQFSDIANFDSGIGAFNLTAHGNVDAFLTKTRRNGDMCWATQIGGASGEAVGRAVTIDIFNGIYSTGYFRDTVDFDPAPTTIHLQYAISEERYVQKLNQCIKVFGTDTRTECGSYTWIDGNTYTASNNTANHTLRSSSANGCDSVVTLNLTILQPVAGTDSRTECVSYTWIDGNTYTSSNNTASHTLQGSAANGCDSVVTLDLTILQPASGTDTKTECVSYTWIDGNTYTSSNNTASHTLQGSAANGCDSVVTLDLTILQPASGTDTRTECVSYTWIDGNTYTSSNNTASHTLQGSAANGCDSVVALDLTILQPASGTDTRTECVSYTWIDGNTYTSSNNTASHTLQGSAANGCDSMVTLDLTILQPASGTDLRTECVSYTWIDGNTYTSSNNTASHTLQGSNGCDSIVTLDLTIINVDTSVTVAGNTITANAVGAQYQWVDCNNGGVAISGENNQSFSPANDGSFAVIVTQNGCSDTSKCYDVIITTYGFSELSNLISVFPNPNKGVINIDFGNITNATFQVFNTFGQRVFLVENVYGKESQFNLDGPNGIYILRIFTQGQELSFPLIKQ